jgi:hypothetical protein
MDNEPTIDVMNEAIGIFMGGLWKDVEIAGKPIKRFYYEDKPFMFVKSTEQLCYHNDWNVLMPAVLKAKALYLNFEDGQMRDQLKMRYKAIENELRNLSLINTHYCLFRFIKWYNNQSNNGQ